MITPGPSRPALVLIGPPGTGKTTVGRHVAQRLGVDFVDTDELIAEEAGQHITDMFLDLGEEGFRASERATAARVLQEFRGVVALGSGAVEHPQTRVALESLPVVFLDVSMAAGIPRVGLNAPRSVLMGSPRSAYKSLAAERRPLYQQCANWTVDTSELTAEQVSEHVITLVNDADTV